MFVPVTDVPAFVAYATAMCITPGPNNAMLATMGARFGWRSAAPAVAGISIGMFVLMVAAGTGLAAAVASVPGLSGALAAFGVAYMAYMAFKLWRTTGGVGEGRPPMGFWGAVAFQAVNPKALLMALTAAGSFAVPAAGTAGAVGLAVCYVAVGLPCIMLWVVLGDRLRGVLAEPARAQVFTRTMAVVMAASAVALAV